MKTPALASSRLKPTLLALLWMLFPLPCPSSPQLSWQIRDLASELLVRYFPATFPEPVTLALSQLAQHMLGSPRVQEAEAGAVLMKIILQKYKLSASPPLRWHGSPRVCRQHRCLAGVCVYSSGQQWLGFEIA